LAVDDGPDAVFRVTIDEAVGVAATANVSEIVLAAALAAALGFHGVQLSAVVK
jgi:hypothetical protein